MALPWGQKQRHVKGRIAAWRKSRSDGITAQVKGTEAALSTHHPVVALTLLGKICEQGRKGESKPASHRCQSCTAEGRGQGENPWLIVRLPGQGGGDQPTQTVTDVVARFTWTGAIGVGDQVRQR